MEPYRLREWRTPAGRIFTCGRPGRSKWKAASYVPMSAIHKWVQNLPAGDLVILSLLGKKPDGTSEFSFYPFRGGFDPHDRPAPSFEEWLAQHYPQRNIIVREYPTADFLALPTDTLELLRLTSRTQLGEARPSF